MFREARLKLTLWYLVIIMMISLAFSGVIYRSATFELRRFAEAQQNRFERRVLPFPTMVIDEELMDEARGRIRNSLILINLFILAMSSVLGYYLSGKTLSPIQEMMDGQYRFVTDASHELKTPLTAMKTTLEVAIRDKNLQLKEAKETLVSSLEEVNRLQKLAEGLLELTHKNIVSEMKAVDIAQVVNTSIKILMPLAAKKKIEIQTKVSKMIALLDEASITRALMAIIDNSIKYSDSGKSIRVIGKIKDNQILLQIIDEGKGIDADQIDKVFERFYRSDLSRSEKGYGLGLAIAKQIVEEHDGTMTIKSRLGQGTTLSIHLPYSAKLQK